MILGFFLMILAPCAFAIFSSKENEDGPQPRRLVARNFIKSRSYPATWRATHPSLSAEYDLVLSGDPQPARAHAITEPHSHPAVTLRPTPSSVRQLRASANLLNVAAAAEADSVAAQLQAARANKAALTAAARAAAARAAAATALAVEAERAVAEAARLAAAMRRAYETAPASVGPEHHALPETHPSMDFPRSHVIHRAA